MRRIVLACLVGCGGGDGSKVADAAADGLPRDAAIDATPDAPTAVRRVPCPATPDQTVTTANFAWTPPSVSITKNQIVKFAPENIHRVVPHASKPTDPGMSSGATGEVRCLMFTESGEFNYQCGPHPSMQGVVQVAN